jgi:hypothetical protein
LELLKPDLTLISQEFVLVQAWKKTVSLIRYQNWFSDTLELDRAAADLPDFLGRLSERLSSGNYQTAPLALVPAPKSQKWNIRNGKWGPAGTEKAKVRPLAHVALADQVAATAVMLCLSDRVESVQGDPRSDYWSRDDRKQVVSLGNRLFCDTDEKSKQLVHRWGSSKLYRAYFQDYRTFLNRPEVAAEQVQSNKSEVFIVQTDLKQFYDRVTPQALHAKINGLKRDGDDHSFYELANSVLNWDWREQDKRQFELHKEYSKIPDFQGVALPQGLIAAGFFSNVMMLEFDRIASSQIGNEIATGIYLEDICRYVDDIRVTISTSGGMPSADAQNGVVQWITRQLDASCDGMEISEEKTETVAVKKEEQRLVYQSRKMERIQGAISGGFDATGGEEVLYAIEALVRSQENLEPSNIEGSSVALKALPDVKDDTVGRFAAGRFRRTYRSLRPLLMEGQPLVATEHGGVSPASSEISQAELDDEARSFSLMLIQRWIGNPANVRLLRVALDLWPSPQVLNEVLKIFEPYLSGEATSRDPRRIAHYCLGEIFRAGATETGFVESAECLPKGVDIKGYRDLLLKVATRVAVGSVKAAPWYLIQQALLYIIAHEPKSLDTSDEFKSNANYWQTIKFIQGHHDGLSDRDFAVSSIVCRRSFLLEEQAIDLVSKSLTSGRFKEIAARDLAFAESLTLAFDDLIEISSGVRDDLGNSDWSIADGMQPLHQVVKEKGSENPLRNEIGILTFAKIFLQEVRKDKIPSIVTPSTVQISTKPNGKFAEVDGIAFRATQKNKGYQSIYSVPAWVDSPDRWRFQLGYLIRFILTSEVDFSLPVRKASWRENHPIYRPTRAHWVQRQYGFYNGHEAFGDNWLPISQFTQELVFALLAWPGCRPDNIFKQDLTLEVAIAKVDAALTKAKSSIGESTGMLMLQVDAPMLGTGDDERPLRGCVVQSIMPETLDLVPDPEDLSSADLEIRNPITRKKHRRHLSASLAAIRKMLELRQTHKPENKSLDWVIFPELSVHPDDVDTILVPFVRKYKAAILVGLGYERVLTGQPLVNSALWIIPKMVPGKGLQVVIRRQGKEHLSPLETPFNVPVQRVAGFRPCQWLIGYEWSRNRENDPLWLSAAVCYDATDLKLASDLRTRSDVFAIPALNKDIGTFDQMAQALHYHMYQLILVSNNGTYGGSNAYIPKGNSVYVRQIFHTHGQPQATISFFEIEDIREMKERRTQGLMEKSPWKHPPAGY